MKKTLSALCVGAVVMLAAGNVWAGPPTQGVGGFDFGASLVPWTTPAGETGRAVYLWGAIEGFNFEPGICVPDPNFFGKCAVFAKREPVGPGEFLRAHPGQTAFTVCSPCTIDGRTGSFTLKISYPDPKNITFTRFTIQDAAGDLAGLKGQGTLDFTNGHYEIQYQFAPSKFTY
jgi:hypothetical protein